MERVEKGGLSNFGLNFWILKKSGMKRLFRVRTSIKERNKLPVFHKAFTL